MDAMLLLRHLDGFDTVDLGQAYNRRMPDTQAD
jgi:hypothetical protein